MAHEESSASAYVRQYYSIDGVEVLRGDKNELTVSLPPIFDDLTYFTEEMHRKFGLLADYRWNPTQKTGTLIMTASADSDSGGCNFALLMSAVTMVVTMIVVFACTKAWEYYGT